MNNENKDPVVEKSVGAGLLTLIGISLGVLLLSWGLMKILSRFM